MDECARFQYLNDKEDEGWEILKIMALDNVDEEKRESFTSF